MSFIAQIFTTLTVPQFRCIDISYDEYHSYRSVSAKFTGRYSLTSTKHYCHLGDFTELIINVQNYVEVLRILPNASNLFPYFVISTPYQFPWNPTKL
jgi:hypothetical protein